MKPEDRKRLKQHIEMIVEHKTKSYEELEAENKSLRHILSLWKKTEAMKEIDELKEIIRDFIIGFSIDVFGVRPNGNSAFGCDEGEVRGNEYLRELLKRAELYAHTDIVDEISTGVKSRIPENKPAYNENANSLLRSAWMIANRNGEQTNWEAFKNAVYKELVEEHEIKTSTDNNKGE